MPKNRREIASRQNKLAQAAINWLLLFTILTTTIISSSVRAQDERVTVRLDGRSVFRVSAVQNNAPQARAQQIERRMNRLLENPEAIAAPRIEITRAARAERVITIARVPVVTVTPADAQDNLTTVDALAIQWSQAIDNALKRASQRRLSSWGRLVAEVQASVVTAFGRGNWAFLGICCYCTLVDANYLPSYCGRFNRREPD